MNIIYNGHYRLLRTLGMLRLIAYYSRANSKGNEHSSKTVSSSNDTIDRNNAYLIEFDKFWFGGIAITNQDFYGYYDKFRNQNMNDIRHASFDNDIENVLERNISVDSLQNLQIIRTKVEFVGNEFKEFINCEIANLREYRRLFEYHASYSLNALKNAVKNKTDIINFIKSYNNDSVIRFFEINTTDINELCKVSNF